MGIPTIVAFTNGTELFRRVGIQNDLALEEIFRAAAQARKPEFQLSGRDRILRGILGFIATAVGAASGPNVLRLLAGGILMFSAVYDRCPIYRAVMAKLRALFAPNNTRPV